MPTPGTTTRPTTAGTTSSTTKDREGDLTQARGVAVRRGQEAGGQEEEQARQQDEAGLHGVTRMKPMARTCKFQEESTKCKLPVDFTDQMVGRGLADEEVKRKLLAKPEEKSSLEKTLRFVEPRRAASTT